MKTKERSVFKKVVKSEILAGNLLGKKLLSNDKNISILVSGTNTQALKSFKRGFELFKFGHWTEA